MRATRMMPGWSRTRPKGHCKRAAKLIGGGIWWHLVASGGMPGRWCVRDHQNPTMGGILCRSRKVRKAGMVREHGRAQTDMDRRKAASGPRDSSSTGWWRCMGHQGVIMNALFI